MEKPRFTDPHTDPMPRDLAEVALKECSPSQFKILYALARKTIGFRTFSDRVPLSQIMDMTNLTKRTVKEGLKKLEEEGWIEKLRDEKGFSYVLTLNRCVGEFLSLKVFRGIKFSPPGWISYPYETENEGEFLPPQETFLETIIETGVASPPRTQLKNFQLWEGNYGREYALRRLREKYKEYDPEMVAYLTKIGEYGQVVYESRALYIAEAAGGE